MIVHVLLQYNINVYLWKKIKLLDCREFILVIKFYTLKIKIHPAKLLKKENINTTLLKLSIQEDLWYASVLKQLIYTRTVVISMLLIHLKVNKVLSHSL